MPRSWFAIIGMVVLLQSAMAEAAPRVALIVGNGAYDHVGGLRNPGNDARLMEEALRYAGFEVTTVIDADRESFERAIREFGETLRRDRETIGLFYFAGHGVQSFGSNYLLPTDTLLLNEADLDLVAISASSVLRQMYTAQNKANIVILDACRNNPFDHLPSFTDNGLAEMKAPTGTFLSYSTAPGAVALDGEGSNSLFTQALASEIQEAGQPLEKVFRDVRVRVLEASGWQQTPWDASSLTAEFTFVSEEPLSPAQTEERMLWESVVASGDPLQAMLFLRAYPDSRYAPEAQALLTAALGNASGTPSAGAREEAEAVPEPPVEVPVPEVAAEPSGAPMTEQAALELAKEAGTVEGYEAFLRQYPEGVFAELARAEISAIRRNATTDPSTPDERLSPEIVALPEPEPETVPIQDNVTFFASLSEDNVHTDGRSIADLIKGQPVYPPIEGLPAEAWENRQCASCHDWTPEALCEQGAFYVANNAARNIGKLHPYGGAFKQRLRAWASTGCAE